MAQLRYHTAPLLKPTALFEILTTLISVFKLIVQTNGHDSRWTTKTQQLQWHILYLPRFHRPSRWLFKFDCSLSIFTSIDWCMIESGTNGEF